VTEAVEVLICEECGEEIDPPHTAVVMIEQIEVVSTAGKERFWRDGLACHFHVGCAPGELVGVWRRGP
jgi:hypothetical protein